MNTATQSEAHIEWHLNSGVPVGQPCPWDACQPDEHGYEDEEAYQAFVQHLRGLSDDELDNERYTYERQPQFAGDHEVSVEDRLGAVRDELSRRCVERSK